jgi:hypothetical protein
MGVSHRKDGLGSALTAQAEWMSRNVAIGPSAAIVRADFDGRPDSWTQPGPTPIRRRN